MSELALTFFGVRGSHPVADRRMLRYGGNSASIMLEINDEILIFDAGTGIIPAGKYLTRNHGRCKRIYLFLTHLHMDHIQGLPFFRPLYDPEYEIVIHVPEFTNVDFRGALYALFMTPYSPITLDGIKARIFFVPLDLTMHRDVVIGNDIAVAYAHHNSHPLLGVLIFRVDHAGRRIVYATDVESPDGFDPQITRFVQDADVLIHDSQYLDRDYFHPQNPKQGYGHSTVAMAAQNAVQSKAKRLFLFHYDPSYDDVVVARMLLQARKRFKKSELARETKKISLLRS